MRLLDSATDSMDMSLRKFQEMLKNREDLHAAAQGITKLDTTEWLNNRNLKFRYTHIYIFVCLTYILMYTNDVALVLIQY